MSEKYIFNDSGLNSEYERLRKIENVFDPVTRKILRHLGLPQGSVCLEVGPGAGSLMQWLCHETGPEGRVVAVERDPRFLEQIHEPNLTVKTGDIFKMDLPQEHFDFIHARYVLIHNPEPQALISKLYKALKPGGNMLIEEPDFTEAALPVFHPVYSPAFVRIREAILRLFQSLELDPALGGKLSGLFQQAGLVQTGHQVWAEKMPGKSIIADFMRLSTTHLKEKYIQTGAADEKDIEAYMNMTQDEQFQSIYYGSHSVWGKRSL